MSLRSSKAQPHLPTGTRYIALNGPKLATIRIKEKNWSQGELGHKAGVSTNTVIRAERGDAIQRANAHAVAGALGVELRALLPPGDSVQLAEQRFAGWDPFNDFIEDRTRDFVGRGYVFAAVKEFLTAASKGYFIIEGDPGMGKSSIIAEWVRRNHSVAFFNIRQIGRNRADQFLESVCLQLISRYRLPYDALPPNATQDGDFLSRLLTEARSKQDGKEKLVLAVDALDEVDFSAQSANSNALYLPEWLPEGVYLLVTRRRQRHLPFTAQAPQKIIDLLKDYSVESRRDIETYIQSASRRPQLRSWLDRTGVGEVKFVETLTDKSENNFMYLYYVLPEIEHGTYRDLDIEKLPVGLEGYYMDHWRVMGMLDRPLKRSRLNILYVLAEVVQPVSRRLIADFTEEDGPTVQETLDEWVQFLHEELVGDTKRYSVYHTSFREFLHRQDILQAAEVTIPDIHGRIADKLWDKVYGDDSP
jgi:transcriptional regulator with XRE-family HTH domain